MNDKWNLIQSGLLLIALAGVCILWVSNVKKTNRIDRNICKVLLMVAIVSLISVFITRGYEATAFIRSIKQDIVSMADHLRYGAEKSDLKERLIVKREKYGEIYLRGMVGVLYEDGKWMEELEDKESVFTSMFSYLQQHGFYPQSQLENVFREQEYEKNKISVKNVGASRKYIYAPLSIFASSLENEKFKHVSDSRIFPAGLFGEKEYAYDVIQMMDGKELDVHMTGNDNENELIYRSYIYQNYMEIPSDLLTELNEADLSSVGGENAVEVLESVQAYIKKLPEMTSKEYASYGAMVLRYCGMPTRYIDGYYISDEEKSLTVTLTEEDRHQWVEVYLDGVGFITFETNPKYFDEKSTEVKGQAASGNDVTQNSVDAYGKQQEKRMKIDIPFILGVLIFFVFMLSVLHYSYRRKIRKRKLYSKNMMEFLSFLCNRLENVLKYDIVELDMNRPYDYQAIILLRYGIHMYYAYKRFIFYMDEILFQQAVLSEDELADMRKTISRFEHVILEKQNPCRRFWIRYFI